jgi:hypothetical protein
MLSIDEDASIVRRVNLSVLELDYISLHYIELFFITQQYAHPQCSFLLHTPR